MSILIHLGIIKDHFREFRQILPSRLKISTTQKIIIISVTTSIAVVGILARYLRRKKIVTDSTRIRKIYSGKRSRFCGIRSPNGDVVSQASSSGRRSAAYSTNIYGDRIITRQQGSSVASGSLTSVGIGNIVPSLPVPLTSATFPAGGTSQMVGGSNSTIGPEASNTTNGQLTPQQIGVMAMEALETCINYWEDALALYTNGGGDGSGNNTILGPEETNFCKDLQYLLDAAIELQEKSEILFLDQRSVLFRPDDGSSLGGGSNKIGPAGEENGFETDMSGGESFASAQDMVADLREFDEFSEYFPDLDSFPLYQTALRHLENGGIPCRTVRTELVKVASDGEYLAKLHCLRLAFQHILRNRANYIWFVDSGRQILADLLLYAERDPKDFFIGYEEMLKYIQEAGNWHELEEELSQRGVKALTFYDVVLDYILMDAFADLDSPPSSVTAVVQNRWLSNGFKETALTTAVWSVLKAKRRMLKFPKGFMAHFYTISEQLSPLLAWGFLGPDEMLHETCVYFKDQVIGFLVDIFNFQKCRYASVEELAADVIVILRNRIGNIGQRLSA